MTKLLTLIVGVAAIFAVWNVADPACEAVMGPVAMANPAVEGLDGFFSLVWLGLRLFFWLLVGLIGTAAVLLALASVGVLTWVVQQLCRGFVYVSQTIREMLEPTDEDEQVVATIPSGAKVTAREVLENHEQRLATLEAKSESV